MMKGTFYGLWAAAALVVGLLVCVGTCFDYCSTPCVFPKHTYKHTMCVYPKEEPGPKCNSFDKSVGLSEEDKVNLVKWHNELRSKVALGKETDGDPGPQPPAANMLELVWDDELETIAKRWAYQCEFGHDQCRATKDRAYVGQNLAMGSDPKGLKNGTFALMNQWYDEVKFTPKDTVKVFVKGTAEKGAIGHYTQFVWAETERVGCALTYFDYSDWEMTEYLVCNYGRGGNVKTRPIYKIGEHCTACGKGVQCSTIYPGLCEAPSKRSTSPTNSSSTDDSTPSNSSISHSPPPDMPISSGQPSASQMCSGILQWTTVFAFISTILVANSYQPSIYL